MSIASETMSNRFQGMGYATVSHCEPLLKSVVNVHSGAKTDVVTTAYTVTPLYDVLLFSGLVGLTRV